MSNLQENVIISKYIQSTFKHYFNWESTHDRILIEATVNHNYVLWCQVTKMVYTYTQTHMCVCVCLCVSGCVCIHMCLENRRQYAKIFTIGSSVIIIFHFYIYLQFPDFLPWNSRAKTNKHTAQRRCHNTHSVSVIPLHPSSFILQAHTELFLFSQSWAGQCGRDGEKN